MLDECMMGRLIDAMPWPKGTKPIIKYGETEGGLFVVLLHESVEDGWQNVAHTHARTPECALRFALAEWCIKKGLEHRPGWDALKKAIGALSN